jgi:hypothetical protein
LGEDELTVFARRNKLLWRYSLRRVLAAAWALDARTERWLHEWFGLLTDCPSAVVRSAAARASVFFGRTWRHTAQFAPDGFAPDGFCGRSKVVGNQPTLATAGAPTELFLSH